jgi:hypothetical protein
MLGSGVFVCETVAVRVSSDAVAVGAGVSVVEAESVAVDGGDTVRLVVGVRVYSDFVGVVAATIASYPNWNSAVLEPYSSVLAGELSDSTANVCAPPEYVAICVDTIVGEAAEQSPVMTETSAPTPVR